MTRKDEERQAAETAFERVKAKLKARLGPEVYSSWFGRMLLSEASRTLIRLSVPTAFLRAWINSHYAELISELWREEQPAVLRVELIVRSTARPV
ncbi:MAG: DnaA N-terminal domain-containing protein, partial [Rhizobiaceae bacterium]